MILISHATSSMGWAKDTEAYLVVARQNDFTPLVVISGGVQVFWDGFGIWGEY
jgi:hypothetical protein